MQHQLAFAGELTPLVRPCKFTSRLPDANAPINSAEVPSSPACSFTDVTQTLLRGIGVREVQKAAIEFQQTGILCRDDFVNLDSEQRRELDGELKSAGITLGDVGGVRKPMLLPFQRILKRTPQTRCRTSNAMAPILTHPFRIRALLLRCSRLIKPTIFVFPPR